MVYLHSTIKMMHGPINIRILIDIVVFYYIPFPVFTHTHTHTHNGDDILPSFVANLLYV